MTGINRRAAVFFGLLLLVSSGGALQARPSAALASASAEHPFQAYCARESLKPQSPQGHSLAVLKRSLGVSSCAALTEALRKRDGLSLAGTGLRDLSFLQYFHHFRQLDLSNNHIQNLRPLAHLYQLTQLWLGENAIRDISPLGRLLGLEVLGLDDNEIQDVSALKPCRALIAVDLSNNRLSEVKALLTLAQLRVLYLSYNSLESLADFSTKGLGRSYTENKAFHSAYTAQVLAGAPHFEVLALDHNPVALGQSKPALCPLETPYPVVRSLCLGP